MLVRSRSYGTSLIMLYRGPQFTQEVAQYPSYLPPGVKISEIQSSQIAISGGIMPENEPVPLLRITKPSGISAVVSVTSTESIRDIGGPRETAARKV
jgi:hypothetical protein